MRMLPNLVFLPLGVRLIRHWAQFLFCLFVRISESEVSTKKTGRRAQVKISFACKWYPEIYMVVPKTYISWNTLYFIADSRKKNLPTMYQNSSIFKLFWAFQKC